MLLAILPSDAVIAGEGGEWDEVFGGES